MPPRKVPVYLSPDDSRTIVVFGGGNVAYRKCKQFEGFHIKVIADKTIPEMKDACSEIVLEHFDPSDIGKYLEGAFIAVAATDSKTLNAAITESAKKAGVLINSAHGGGNVLLPSSVRKDGYTISISSEGSVPAFPPYVAKKIDEFLGEDYDLMLNLLMDLRKDLQSRVKEQPMRAKFLAEVLECESIWNYLKSKDIGKAREEADRIEEKYH